MRRLKGLQGRGGLLPSSLSPWPPSLESSSSPSVSTFHDTERAVATFRCHATPTRQLGLLAMRRSSFRQAIVDLI